jgi:hypothetical protein
MALTRDSGERSGEGRCGQAVRLAETFRALAEVFFALARPPRRWLGTARRYPELGIDRALTLALQFFPARPLCADTS